MAPGRITKAATFNKSYFRADKRLQPRLFVLDGGSAGGGYYPNGREWRHFGERATTYAVAFWLSTGAHFKQAFGRVHLYRYKKGLRMTQPFG